MTLAASSLHHYEAKELGTHQLFSQCSVKLNKYSIWKEEQKLPVLLTGIVKITKPNTHRHYLGGIEKSFDQSAV